MATKKNIRKSLGLERVWQAWMDVSDEEAQAITDVFDEYGLDFENVGGLIQLASDRVGKSTKKSKLSKEYRVNADRDIDIDIMAGELTVRVSDVQSGWAKNKQIDVMNLPWQIVGNITEILGENWDEIPQFVAIENALVEQYDEHWQEVDRQLREQNGWKSTKKSKSVKKGLSWIDPDPIYHKMWEKFVPSTGKADTDFGETLRCASRVIYRFYNDGDKYNVGYGRETVNPALDWLADSCPYPNVSQVAQELRQFMNDNVQHYDAFENRYGEIEEPAEDYFDASEDDYQDFLIDLNEAVTDSCYQKERELDSEAEDRSYYASTKKSIQKPINKTMSFEDNVNKLRKSNYDRTGNLNTIIKERR